MLNSILDGRVNIYLKEQMQKAMDNGESEVNTGVIDLTSQFSNIFDDNPDYPVSKSHPPTLNSMLTWW